MFTLILVIFLFSLMEAQALHLLKSSRSHIQGRSMVSHDLKLQSLGAKLTTVDENGTRRSNPGSAVLRMGAVISASLVAKTLSKILVRRWVAVEAGAKFMAAGGWRGIYATIPLIAGIVNMLTNRVSVWMIFSPVEYWGSEFVKRAEGSPMGLLGWQGIVPARVKSMGPDVARTLISLVNLREIFSRVDAANMASLMSPPLEAIVSGFVKARLYDQSTNPLMMSIPKDAAIYTSFDGLYGSILGGKMRGSVETIIQAVQQSPEYYVDLETSLVEVLVRDKRIICELFQTVGKSELDFIVRFGLYGGFALGVLQMLMWLMWSPAWSLVVGGGLVGYLTDYIALAVMFRPVEPVQVAHFITIQGLFLKRQKQVSGEFSELACARLLSSAQLWSYLCEGPRRHRLMALIERELRHELQWLLPAVGDGEWSALAESVLEALPAASVATHGYMEQRMKVQEDVATAMAGMAPAQFERVLHPIFEEDEKTLIAVGTVLGAAASAGQAAFY